MILIKTDCYALGSDNCNKDSLGRVTFRRNKSTLSISNKRTLDSLISLIKNRLDCSIVLLSNGKVSCHGDEKYNQRKWDRIESIISYLVRSGIPRDRMVFQFGSAEEYTIELYLDNKDLLQQQILPPMPLLNHRK